MRVNCFKKEEIVKELNDKLQKDNLDTVSFESNCSSLLLEKSYPIIMSEEIYYEGSFNDTFAKGRKTSELSKEDKLSQLNLLRAKY